jgi:type II secretory pathway pseudopilin PulG
MTKMKMQTRQHTALAISVSRRLATRHVQCGQAFLLMLLVLGIFATTLAYRFVWSVNSTVKSDLRSETALAQVREALLGYAAAHATRPGRLPCPDTLNIGFAGTCSALGSPPSIRIGRVPWKSLKLADLRDGSGEQLWYAVSRNFAANSIINSDTAAEYTAIGTSPANNVVAVVFAPGPVLAAQLRDATVAPCSTTGTSMARNLCAANFLEGGNADGSANFVTGLANDAFNDKLIVITHDMLFKRVLQRVAYHARKVLIDYYTSNAFFPTANAYSDATGLCTVATTQGRFALPPTSLTGTGLCTDSASWSGANLEAWFANNQWNNHVFYAVSAVCIDAASAAACAAAGSLTVTGKSSNSRALLIATGGAYTGQGRPCASVSDCLEDPENVNGDSVFVTPTASSTNNDQLIIVSP